MFICEECLKQLDVATPLLKSRGPCEICGKTTVCYDLPPGAYKPKQDIKSTYKTRKISLAVSEFIEFNDTVRCIISLPSAAACYIYIEGEENLIRVKGKRNRVVVEGDNNLVDMTKTTESIVSGMPTHDAWLTSEGDSNLEAKGVMEVKDQ